MFNQTIEKSEYELIVVDDCSTDSSVKVLEELQQIYNFTLFIQPQGKGPAAARNRGLYKARNEVVLFTQDDIIVNNTFLETHLNFHTEHPDVKEAMVGHITWDKTLTVTPFMYWLEHGGPQFDFERLKDGQITDFLAFYTPNISLKKDFLIKHNGFDEDIRPEPGLCAYEDTELGWRLYQDDMKLYYIKDALAYHHHHKSLQSVLRRKELEGKMTHILKQKNPGFSFDNNDSTLHNLKYLKTAFLPDPVRSMLARIVLNPLTMKIFEPLAYYCEARINFPIVFKLVCAYHYNLGYSKNNE